MDEKIDYILSTFLLYKLFVRTKVFYQTTYAVQKGDTRNTRKKKKQHCRWTETHMCTVLVNICAVVFLSILYVVFSRLVELVWLACDLNMVLKNDVIFPFFSITSIEMKLEKKFQKVHIKLRCAEFAVFYLQDILNAEFVYVACNLKKKSK